MPEIIKIAADSIENLRTSDVFRVLDECPAGQRNEAASYISEHRKDLCGEVAECLEELAAA